MVLQLWIICFLNDVIDDSVHILVEHLLVLWAVQFLQVFHSDLQDFLTKVKTFAHHLVVPVG